MLNLRMLMQARQRGCSGARQCEVWDGRPEHGHVAADGQEPGHRGGCWASRGPAAHRHALCGERPAMLYSTEDAGRSAAGGEHDLMPAIALPFFCKTRWTPKRNFGGEAGVEHPWIQCSSLQALMTLILILF